MSIWDLVEGIYCINLDSEHKRRNEFLEMANKLQFSHKLQIVSAIKMEPHRHACFHSHLKVLKLALEKKQKCICVFEDDARDIRSITQKDYNKLQSIMNEKEWSIIFLGYEPDVHLKQGEIINTLDAHSFIINETGMNWILDFYNKYGIILPVDVVLWFCPNTYCIDPIFTQQGNWRYSKVNRVYPEQRIHSTIASYIKHFALYSYWGIHHHIQYNIWTVSILVLIVLVGIKLMYNNT